MALVAATMLWIGTIGQMRVYISQARLTKIALLKPLSELLEEADREGEQGLNWVQLKLKRFRRSFRPTSIYKRLQQAIKRNEAKNPDRLIKLEREVADLLSDDEVRGLENYEMSLSAWVSIMVSSIFGFSAAVSAISNDWWIAGTLGFALFVTSCVAFEVRHRKLDQQDKRNSERAEITEQGRLGDG